MLIAAGCAPVPAAPDPNAGVPLYGGTGRTCKAEPARGLVGRAASSDVGAEALRLTGAGTLRWIRPGDMVTMDFRPDRLNIELDAQGRVARLRCG